MRKHFVNLWNVHINKKYEIDRIYEIFDEIKGNKIKR